MLIYIQSFLLIVLCIMSTITDIREKKIFNKSLIIFICISLFFNIIFYSEYEKEYLIRYFINFFISFIISFLFFYFKIWSAGDAKLFCAEVFILPYSLYETQKENIFPSIYLLVIIFCIAFLYVIAETVFLWIKDKNKFSKDKNIIINYENKTELIIKYLLGYFITIFINNILNTFFREFLINNGIFIVICNMLLLLFIYRVINNTKKCFFITCVFLTLNVIYYIIYGFKIYEFNLKMIFLVAVLILFRRISEKYNYEEIKVQDLKPRMILAYQSVILFYSSKVKGLPVNTTETTDSRLTEDEVDSIKRWSKTKKGKDSIVIVRHMPFAPFMFVGTVMFLILKLFL